MKKFFFLFFLFLILVLPASILVKAWMLSVRIDFACVRARMGRLGRKFGPDDDEATGLAGPALQGEEPLLNCMDPSTLLPPPPPKPKSPCSQTFKGLPARNSCSECIMEERRKKKSRYNHGVVCLLHSHPQ